MRRLLTSVTFSSIDKAPRAGNIKPAPKCKLKVPLLKAPSHLGHYSSRANRLYNEDAYSATVLDLPTGPVFNFSIFDGHGGSQCSQYLQGHLAKSIESLAVDPLSDGAKSLVDQYASNIGGYWRRWAKTAKHNWKRMGQVQPQVQQLERVPANDDLLLRLPLAFLQADYDFFGTPDNKLGSTCTSAFLSTLHSGLSGNFVPVYEDYYFNRNTVSKLTVAHVGDSKAILVDRTGEANALTHAHHPLNPTEASRLRRYAANYFMTDSFGEERFISLANTRAFGDLSFKLMGVSAEPEVSQYVVGDAKAIDAALTAEEIRNHTINGLGGDECFLILATDGITNELTDQEIADIVMVNFNLRGHNHASPHTCAQEVVKFVEYIGGDDNATCMVIRLNGWGKWPVLDRTGSLRQERMSAFVTRDRGG